MHLKTDIIKAEAEFRNEMYEVHMEEENIIYNGDVWHLEDYSLSDTENTDTEDDWESCIHSNLILENILEKKKKVCWIVGDHGVGKSSFGAYIASAWAWKNLQLKHICTVSVVFVISLAELKYFSVTEENIFLIFFPLTSFFLSEDVIKSWLKGRRCLFIVDDVTQCSEKIVKMIFEILQSYDELTVWFMGRIPAVMKYKSDSLINSESVFLELKGFKEEEILNISQCVKTESTKYSLFDKLKNNMNRLGKVIKYPTVFRWTLEIWEENPRSFENIYTASDLMWEILAWKVKKVIKINIKKTGSIRQKFLNWLMLAGELALYCLKADLRLDTHSLEELESKIVSLYKGNGRTLLKSFFKPAIQFSYSTCFTVISSTSRTFLEYLSSWFFMDQLVQNIHVKQLTNDLVNELPLILFGAGHLERFHDEGSIGNLEERKLIKTLINYRKGSYEDFSFIQMFIAEMKCIKKLVEIVIDETEYNEEWNLNTSEVQRKSLEVLLNHVSPTRLILLENVSRNNYELEEVINYICRVDISVWLDSMSQFKYGDTHVLDKLVEPFLDEIVAPKVDLISGALSSQMLEKLKIAPSTQHLVLLKLKVSSNEALNQLLIAPKFLPNLLWLEIKLDMNFNEIEIASLQHTNVALFDVYLRHINESDVSSLSDLLTAMNLRFTGIHLEETTLSPEAVFALLKELGKRSVSLRGENDQVMKFRMWYYPSLSSLPKGEKVSEEECLNIIGHNDQEFFSAHHVISSQFVTVIDAWNLRNYLENEENIVHFIYETSNVIFIKRLDGFVEISFKGDYREVLHDKVGKARDIEEVVDVEHEVLDLY